MIESDLFLILSAGAMLFSSYVLGACTAALAAIWLHIRTKGKDND